MFLLKKLLFIVIILLTCLPAGSQPIEPIVVLYTSKDKFLPDLQKNCCKYYDLEKFHNSGIKAKTVILSGHGAPPVYVSHSAGEVAEVISSFHPELIVLNSCYGASTPILESLAEKNNGAIVVAPPYQIYLPGYIYLHDFFNQKLSAEERAKSVVTQPYYPQLRWKINKPELIKAKAKVLKMTRKELKKNYLRRVPPLVRIPMPESLEIDGEILVLLTRKEVESIKK